jgi:hypothetical protein
MKPLMILLIATVVSLLGEGSDKSEKQVEITKGINFVFPNNTLTTNIVGTDVGDYTTAVLAINNSKTIWTYTEPTNATWKGITLFSPTTEVITNWITKSVTTPVRSNPLQTIYIPSILNQTGYIFTNTILNIEYEGEKKALVIKTVNGPTLQRSIPDENSLSIFNTSNTVLP